MRFLLCWFFSVSVLRSTEAAFTFVLQINGHSTSGTCDTILNSNCETYFSLFCLRGGRTSTSTDTSDCPLGSYRQRFTRQSGSISIHSSAEWEENFQLFIQAFDDDGGVTDADHLDDIFVEGSLRSGTRSSAMTFTGTHNRVTVTVQFQRTCDANYYGIDCFTYCVPADNNAAGHFTCDVNDGSKVCLPGYSNPDNNCRENIDDCSSNPCQNGGNCTDLVSDFTCTCPPGYTGKNCSIDINECEDVYCPGNSTCKDSIAAFTCICNPGYAGKNCSEVLDPCESDPCSSNGTCVMLDSFNSICVCLAGYTGTQCEVNIDECLTANCPPGTTCQDGINSFQCLQQSVEQKTGSNLDGTAIGSILAAVVILVLGCLIFCLLLLIVGIRRKHKKIEVESSRNDYATSPTKSEQGSNPLYGRADSSISSSGLRSPTGSLHVCENSLYAIADDGNINHKMSEKETPFGDKDLIYEEPTSAHTIATSPNMSYESLNLASPGKQLKNPLYGKRLGTPTQGAVTPPPRFSLPPPVYSVPRPASDVNNESLHRSSFDHTLFTEYPGYETAAALASATKRNKMEDYYESIGGTPSQEKIPLSSVSPRHASTTPSPQHTSIHQAVYQNSTR